MLTTSLDDHGRLWAERQSSRAVSKVRGPSWTAVDGRDSSTDQEVGGSNPSDCASPEQQKRPSQDHREGRFCYLGAIPGATAGSGPEQGLAHRVGRRLLVVHEQMPVHVLGDRDAGVPEDLRNSTPTSWATRSSAATVRTSSRFSTSTTKLPASARSSAKPAFRHQNQDPRCRERPSRERPSPLQDLVPNM
jgi:hypothetical protein